MGTGPIKNGKQQVITPRNGKNWADVVNKPVEKPATPSNSEKPAPTGSYLWLGDFKL